MLRAGQPAPQFTLPDADMEMVSLADFRDKHNVVLYFYPKDDTPGCTREAIDFSDLENEFTELRTVVLGVSRDDCLSHGAFRDKHGLQCGYCTPGMIMTAVDLLRQYPDPTEDQIKHALEGNFCRCTGYVNIVASIKWAAALMKQG